MIAGPVNAGDDRLRLTEGTILDGSYVIEGEIGAGGFGITYLARDTRLGATVAIKEYFPVEIGNRDHSKSIRPTTAGQSPVFEWGRTTFLAEARMLADLKHPNIVRVLRFFEANNTAYMVLDFEDGASMSRWLADLGRSPTGVELDRIAASLIDALEHVHARKLVHRDIAPDNIIIRPDGSPVLLDFGAARYEVAELAQDRDHSVHTKSFVVLKRYYSPIEQRSTDKRNRGPWTDVYALGATLYRAISGRSPIDAQDRLAAEGDPLVSASEAAVGRYRPALLDAIDAALRLKRQDRPQTLEAFRALAFPDTTSTLVGRTVTARARETGRSRFTALSFDELFGKVAQQGLDASRRGRAVVLFGAVVGVLVFGAWFVTRQPVPPTPVAPTVVVEPAPTRGDWSRTRDVVETTMRRLHELSAQVRIAMDQQHWPQAQTLSTQMTQRLAEVRPDLERLAGTAEGDGERRTAEAYRQEVATFERRMDEHQRSIAAANHANEEAARRAADEMRATEETRRQQTAQRTPIERFIARYHNIPDPQNFDFSQLFAETIESFGKTRTLPELTADKRAYFRRWTVLGFVLVTDTLRSQQANGEIIVDFEYDWRVVDAKEERWGRGTTNLHLRELSPGNYRITRENGTVTSRESRPLQAATVSGAHAPVPDRGAAACADRNDLRYCVSSVLPTSGVNTAHYGPRSLFDGDSGTAWVEGKSDGGVGEWIVISWPNDRKLTGLRMVNGFARNARLYEVNGRVGRLRLDFSDGRSMEATVVDGSNEQVIPITPPVRTRWVRLQIVFAIRGTRHLDTAISELTPLFE